MFILCLLARKIQEINEFLKVCENSSPLKVKKKGIFKFMAFKVFKH